MNYDTAGISSIGWLYQRPLAKGRTLSSAMKTLWMREKSATSAVAPASVAAWPNQPLIEHQHTEVPLLASEAHFCDLLLKITSDWFWEQDTQFRFTYSSAGGLMYPATSPIAPVGKTLWELPGIDLTLSQWVAYRTALSTHQPFREFEYCIGADAGEEFWFSINGQPLFDEHGCFSGYRGTGRDITERRRGEERQRLAAVVFETAREAIFITDTRRNIVAVNPAFVALSGYSEAEVLGRNPRFLLKAGRHADEHYAPLWETVARQGFWQGEFWNQRKDGETYAVMTTVSEVRDTAGRLSHYVGVATDITHQKTVEQRIEHLAYYDALTDLPNRALLSRRAGLALALAARQRSSLAVLFLDLDRFKEVNDSLGHAEGDALLIQVAARLQEITRHTDTVCRLGGDEFVLLLTTDQEGAGQVADKVLIAFRQPFPLAGHHLRVTVSIGIALYPHDGQNVNDLLKNADAALYRAKQDGRNTRAFYSREMNIATFERLVLESELRQAVATSQLRAYYQPKVRMTDGQIIGAEALVRWQHPDHGLLPPGRFIPLAEASDLIVELGDWMLIEVCRQLAAWRDAGLPPLTVAVNLAARHFRHPGLVAQIQGLLTAHRLPPQALELELTESSLLEVGPQTEETLVALEQMGVGLAIDDFGTGYSSLSYLKRLPLTTLKIDQSFVRNLVNDPDDRTLAATIITLGHGLGLHVVAEGVETNEQRRILFDQGCDLVQGYFFGRPMPAADFVAEWIRQTVNNSLNFMI